MNDISAFIAALENDAKQKEATELVELLTKASGYQAKLSGSIIGFGQYHYQYESGREGDAAVIACSPRKRHLVVYIMPGFDQYEAILSGLGKYKLGKSCLYINKLSDIDKTVLFELAQLSVKYMQAKYECSE